MDKEVQPLKDHVQLQFACAKAPPRGAQKNCKIEKLHWQLLSFRRNSEALLEDKGKKNPSQTFLPKTFIQKSFLFFFASKIFHYLTSISNLK